jgi:hypothetical protein
MRYPSDLHNYKAKAILWLYRKTILRLEIFNRLNNGWVLDDNNLPYPVQGTSQT